MNLIAMEEEIKFFFKVGVILVSLMREINRKRVKIFINVKIVKIVTKNTNRIITNYLSLEALAVVAQQVIRQLSVSHLLLQ